MKTLFAMILALSALLSQAGYAQTQTSFTLGPPHGNYLPALTQNGTPTSGIWGLDYLYDCALNGNCSVYGTLLQENIYISLPHDPAYPGNRLSLHCTGNITLDTRPPYESSVQHPPGVLESAESCHYFNESGASGTWVGTVTYNYDSVFQERCSSGHPYCIWAYFRVLVGGSGTISRSSQ